MNYHTITYPDQNNGDGLRVVLWLSGCSHRCKGCQNPQTWDANSGIPFDESAKEELSRELGKDYISGLTLTGGDPLFENNLDDVLYLVNKIRLLFPQKTIWLYSGYTWEEVFSQEECYKEIDKLIKSDRNLKTLSARYDNSNFMKRAKIIGQSDVFVDGRYINAKQDVALKWRGSSNQRCIDIQKSLHRNEVVLYCD